MQGYKYEYGADCQVGWHERTSTFLFSGKQCPDFSHEKLKNDALKSIAYVKKNSNAKNFSEYFSLMDRLKVASTQITQAAQSYSIQQSRHDARQIWIQTCLGAKNMSMVPVTQLMKSYPHIQIIHISRLFGSATQTVSFMGGVVNCNEQGTYTADIYTSDIDIRKKH